MWPVFKSNFKSVKVVYLTPVPDLTLVISLSSTFTNAKFDTGICNYRFIKEIPLKSWHSQTVCKFIEIHSMYLITILTMVKNQTIKWKHSADWSRSFIDAKCAFKGIVLNTLLWLLLHFIIIKFLRRFSGYSECWISKH